MVRAQTIVMVNVAARVVTHHFDGHAHTRFSLRACFGGLNQSFVVAGSEGTSTHTRH